MITKIYLSKIKNLYTKKVIPTIQTKVIKLNLIINLWKLQKIKMKIIKILKFTQVYKVTIVN